MYCIINHNYCYTGGGSLAEHLACILLALLLTNINLLSVGLNNSSRKYT